MTDHDPPHDHRDRESPDTPGHEGDTGPGSRSMPTHLGDDADTHGGAGDAADGGGNPDAEVAGNPSHVRPAGDASHEGDGHGHADHPGGDHDHPAFLAHHFETPAQQMESGKLGMWVFLATEVLMFGGLFCAYSVYRANNPDIFLFGHQALDTTWGAINTVVLLASSFTMAWGVRAAQLGQRSLLVGLLLLTILGGCGFMLIKTVEYDAKFKHDLQLGGGNAFYNVLGNLTNPDEAEHSAEYIESHGSAAPSHMGAEGKGGHGGHGGHGDVEALGQPGEPSHAESDDSQPSKHPKDAYAADGVTDENPAENVPGDPDAPAAVAGDHVDAPVEDSIVGAQTPVWPPRPAEAELSMSKPPAAPPAGIAQDVMIGGQPEIAFGESFVTGVGAVQAEHQGSHYPRFAELRPLDKERAHIFFQIYFLMTGLHGIHVLVGIGLISWITYYAGGTLTRALLLPGLVFALAGYAFFLTFMPTLAAAESTLLGMRATGWLLTIATVLTLAAVGWAVLNYLRRRRNAKGKFGPEYYTPVDIVGLYWHLVDLIWIFLFPLLYLIH